MEEIITRCRSCGGENIETFLSLGSVPLAENLIAEDELDLPEPAFPIELMFCHDCTFVQLGRAAPPSMIYRPDYHYYSSLIPSMVRLSAECADELIRRRNLGPGSLVMEIGSNDGYMLREFAACGIDVLGIDPALGPAREAERVGVPTVCEFFNAALAARLRAEGRRADVIIANNMINLVENPDDFAAGVRMLLREGGAVVIQSPYLGRMIDDCVWDMIYHGNVGYFSATALDGLFRRHGLGMNGVRMLPDVMGGSLRATFELEAGPDAAVRRLLDGEDAGGMGRPDYYRRFVSRMAENRNELLALIGRKKSRGGRIVAYGAGGGMATTLLCYLGLGRETIDYAVDGNPHKHGFYTVGSRLPIHPPERLVQDMPDCVLLLAWNYADEIIAAQKEYLDRGGSFIIPIPQPRVVSGEPEFSGSV
ncbi:MAG: class I SAM-dependent methyltransferase [Candidatus Sumerlaeia bacterium]